MCLDESFKKDELIKKEDEKINVSFIKRKKDFDELKNELKGKEQMEQYIKNNLKNKTFENFELLDYVDSGSESVIYGVSLINKQKPKEKINAMMKVIISRKRNDNELSISSRLKNKNIINNYGYCTLKKNESTMLFIEPAKYNNLRVFQKTVLKRQILSESLINYITYQILSGLLYLHQCGIAHMDIKPQNLVINEYMEVKIIDFSISINYKNIKKKTIDLPFCGTSFYMSKEVLKEETIKVKDLNKIDLYALGVIIYRLAFGKYPYGLKHGDENDYKEILRKIENEELEMEKKMDYSPSFLDFLSKLLKKNIKERMNINEALNHYWIKGNKLLMEEKEKCGNVSVFLSYLLTDHIKNFNDYVNSKSI